MGTTAPHLRTLPIYLRQVVVSPERVREEHLVPCPMITGRLRPLEECRGCASCHHVSTPGREADWLVVCGFEELPAVVANRNDGPCLPGRGALRDSMVDA